MVSMHSRGNFTRYTDKRAAVRGLASGLSDRVQSLDRVLHHNPMILADIYLC